MKILHVLLSHLPLPPLKYGGTERVVWSLAQAQQREGHEVKFLWRKASSLPANTIIYDDQKPLTQQIGEWPDVVHFHWPYDEECHKPYICTEHGNANFARDYPINTVFLSQRHAKNHHANCYVYNGLDWREYGEPNLTAPKPYVHFLAKAKAPTKNLSGAVAIAKRAKVKLKVLGGSRLNVSRNAYFYPSPRIQFYGMIGGEQKHRLIRNSSGLISPVRWHEPFGLNITESLYLGCPVLATPYGSLPELINRDDIGFLSTSYHELAEALTNISQFDRRACHEVAKALYCAEVMAAGYLACYEKVIAGETLNRQRPSCEQGFIDLLPID